LTIKCTLSIAVLLLGICNSASPRKTTLGKPATFHVKGRIVSPWDVMFRDTLVARRDVSFPGAQSAQLDSDKDVYVHVPHTTLTFHGPRETKSVTVDEKGFYQLDLPVGFYEMSVETAEIRSQKLSPYFRTFLVKSPGTVIINGELYLAPGTCDIVVGGSAEQQLEQMKDMCGGDDKFPLPISDGTPLILYVRFPYRTRSGPQYRYRGETSPQTPVFLAYDLFSLEADEVSYDSKNQLIVASGHVVSTDQTGSSKRADSISFKIKNG